MINFSFFTGSIGDFPFIFSICILNWYCIFEFILRKKLCKKSNSPLYRNVKESGYKYATKMLIITNALETLELNNINDIFVLPLDEA